MQSPAPKRTGTASIPIQTALSVCRSPPGSGNRLSVSADEISFRGMKRPTRRSLRLQFAGVIPCTRGAALTAGQRGRVSAKSDALRNRSTIPVLSATPFFKPMDFRIQKQGFVARNRAQGLPNGEECADVARVQWLNQQPGDSCSPSAFFDARVAPPPRALRRFAATALRPCRALRARTGELNRTADRGPHFTLSSAGGWVTTAVTLQTP
jgi:hypothetical protein